jgi:hypothetical protein
MDNIKVELQDIGWGCGLNSSGSGSIPVARSCKHGNKTLESVKIGYFRNK